MSRAPLVSTRCAARLALASAAGSRAALGAGFAWFLVLAAVYAADAGAPLPAMADTACLLFPVAAWATAAQLSTSSADLRALLTAAGGRGRSLAVDAVPGVVSVLVAALLGVAANVLFDPHPAPLTDRATGLALHLLCGLPGVALALITAAARLTRGGQTLVLVAVALASALVPGLPPVRPVLQAWSGGGAPSVPTVSWAVAGPLLLTALLVGAAARLRRRRP